MLQEGGKMKRIGVLALQGGVEEHLQALSKIKDVQPVSVKYIEDINSIDGLIIPGGESTTLGKLLNTFNMLETLRQKINEGLPVWGTCAGMILLAKHIENDVAKYLGVMDITVKRNAYGRQLGSFETLASIKEVSTTSIPLVFIRAPYVSEVEDSVQVLLKVEDKIVACKQRNMLATAFHPELTDNQVFHEYFVKQFVN